VVLLALSVLALAACTLLLRSVPLSSARQSASLTRLSVIIPAPNEEHNPPRLLQSIKTCQTA
jgi:hypothetical protein